MKCSLCTRERYCWTHWREKMKELDREERRDHIRRILPSIRASLVTRRIQVQGTKGEAVDER